MMALGEATPDEMLLMVTETIKEHASGTMIRGVETCRFHGAGRFRSATMLSQPSSHACSNTTVPFSFNVLSKSNGSR